MKPADLAGEAFRALAAHRLRASLSAIGIVFGVATVVAAFAIGDGARREAVDEIGALGISNVFVRSIPQAKTGPRKEPNAPELTLEDARAIATLPGVATVSGVRTAATEVASGGPHRAATVAGVEPAWERIAEPHIVSGRWLVDKDISDARRVAVLGADLARRLCDGDPVGRRVFAGGQWFHVVGVLAPLSAKPSPIARVRLETAMLVPLTAMDLRLGDGDTVGHVEEIAIASDGPASVAGVAAAIEAMMRRRHRRPGTWELVVPRELLDARLRAERVFNAVLMGVGGLALLISGIGIMNIMLASVAERTQEIGVRRAFGARATEIVAQFAVEAALLSVGGAVVGIPTGVALAAIVALFAGWPVTISLLSVLLALGIAVAVGLSFGVYPARVAARIQPVDALRAP